MQTKDITLTCPQGLHLRVAGAIVHVVQSHDAKVKMICDGCRWADGCSVLQLLTLGARYGASITVQTHGPDEAVVMAKLAEIFADGGGI